MYNCHILIIAILFLVGAKFNSNSENSCCEFCHYCSWSYGSCSTTVTQYDHPWQDPHYYLETHCSDGTVYEEHNEGIWNGNCSQGFIACPVYA